MVSNKRKKQLLKHRSASKSNNPYIDQLLKYQKMYQNYPRIKFLINNIIQSDSLISKGLLPQDLPELLLPDDIQDEIYTTINQTYAANDPKGDQIWNELSNNLPKLDQLIRSYRDYLEDHYGMWAYISAPFVQDISEYVKDKKVLEVMAGNGYISKGLKNLGTTVYPTDSLAWTSENQTGKKPVIDVEPLDALAAIEKYQDTVDYVIMSWSPDGDPIDQQILEAIRKADHKLQLIVIGEKDGATNTTDFWQMANYVEPDATKQLNRHHQPFDLINDQLYLID
ncbi:SAM-dependent methyltransferase [Lentilactobacillus laojiaonis]|uniref:SAM-dependent methyltransferase n=1 Tax=Lentilactobacillus laojiaonis TaxID=2883998 RepID=UPI001D0A5F20|nr:SAM-dependent methyltransferase [Lentilactobacillus laojiaonis]UDM32095.1 SAM-dependent methyltransferase [Lentilactobacillus laojiaonis]